MKKSGLVGFIVFIFLLSACSQGQSQQSNPNDLSWDEIKQQADGTTVNIHMWGGDEGINQYMDEWVAPRLKEQYNITLERVPMDTQNILQKLQSEKQAGKKDGTIDIVWVNGENFKNAKENGLLYGPFRDQLPNFNDYYDQDSLAFQYDFGTPTEGYEAPWGKVQFVFQYDSNKISNPPKSFDELQSWINENPGKFTYPNPDDFSGNAFLRQLLYATVDDPKEIIEEPFSNEYATKKAEPMWEYLRTIKPDLWRNGEHYPASLTELDRLYSQGDVWMTMGYNEARAEHLIEQGVFPESTRSFVMEPGSLGNTHFLAIPFNSSNKSGAMAAINFLLSPDAQYKKLEPTYWGDNTPISVDKLPEEQQKKFESLDRGETVLSTERLENSFLPEADSGYVEWIKENWKDEIIRNQ
ncbi:ABC transporter substrate-binding protein [Pontibacillus yanchengensis]|uniref:ABC transporter substrate-binding protein n=1 Tax=Pontibacillus yanchengensis Y32 TaxID=1385514 RepID=A0A0A2TR55_9BACI|nr:ABC transporter substrate-binding protein [Pontibacillus yanchengensis]KGP71755.1 ABC transporter substrate-binding protein [Pontibacillus yanchengensis Y32]